MATQVRCPSVKVTIGVRPSSSGDRALASGAGSAGSIPAWGTAEDNRPQTADHRPQTALRISIALVLLICGRAEERSDDAGGCCRLTTSS